jgi:hypothetical protein
MKSAIHPTPMICWAHCWTTLMHGRPLNPLTRHWLLKGILRAIRRGESLDTALMLNGAGKSTLQNRLLMIRRNEHLAAAVAAVSLDAQCEPMGAVLSPCA